MTDAHWEFCDTTNSLYACNAPYIAKEYDYPGKPANVVLLPCEVCSSPPQVGTSPSGSCVGTPPPTPRPTLAPTPVPTVKPTPPPTLVPTVSPSPTTSSNAPIAAGAEKQVTTTPTTSQPTVRPTQPIAAVVDQNKLVDGKTDATPGPTRSFALSALQRPPGEIVAGGSGGGSLVFQLNESYNLALTPKNEMYVSDYWNRRVLFFEKPDPLYLNGMPVITSYPYEGNPEAIQVDAEGNVYVASTGGNQGRIVKFTNKKFEGTTIIGGTGRCQVPAGKVMSSCVALPRGFVLDAETGDIRVADQLNHRVSLWLKDSDEGRTIAGGNGQGSTLDKLSEPWDIFVTSDKRVYVAEYSNHRVTQWVGDNSWKPGTSGVLVAGGLGQGFANHQLAYPVSVLAYKTTSAATSLTPSVSTTYVLVADHDNHRVMRYKGELGNFSGEALFGAGGKGDGMDQLNSPSDIVMDNAGLLYVADSLSFRVIRFNLQAVHAANGEQVVITQA